MGVCKTISHDKFPKQGSYLNQGCRVIFNYDTENEAQGVCVRDDAEEPWLQIIKLNDGRHVLTTECQWSPL